MQKDYKINSPEKSNLDASLPPNGDFNPVISDSGTPQLNGNSPVRFIPDLSAAALKQSKHKELGLWYRLRTLDQTGQGWVFLGKAINELVNTFGYSQRTAFRHLNQAEGHLLTMTFNKKGAVIEIHALKRVYAYFDTSADQSDKYFGDKKFREIPALQFKLGLERPLLFASTFKPTGIQANPISRIAIKEYTGIGKSQQLRYQRRVGIKKIACFGVYETDDNGVTKVVPERQPIVTKTQQYFTNKRLPNIYHSPFSSSNRGMLKKVGSELKVRSLNRGEALPTRWYFKRLKSLLKAFWAGRKRDQCHIQAGYYLLPYCKRIFEGRLEWCRHIIPA